MELDSLSGKELAVNDNVLSQELRARIARQSGESVGVECTPDLNSVRNHHYALRRCLVGGLWEGNQCSH